MCSVILRTGLLTRVLAARDKLGRVMSLYTVAFLGVAPLGALGAGMFADRIGATVTVCAGGVACLVVAAVIARQLPLIRRHIRPIYAKLGINLE